MPLRIAHLSSAPFLGGAARAGFRLHEGLSRLDSVSTKWIDAGPGPFNQSTIQVSQPLYNPTLFTKIKARLRRKPFDRLPKSTSSTYSSPYGWGQPHLLEHLLPVDVFNMHWVSWFLNWDQLLPWLANQAPIVWTLHDLNPLRGIWHYDPYPNECIDPWLTVEQQASSFKASCLASIPRDRLTFVCPSSWMHQQVQLSPIASQFPALTIPYGIDTDVFLPTDRRLIRRIANIDDDALVIGCLADDLSDPRKGTAELALALQKLDTSTSLHLLTVGSRGPSFTNVRHTHLGQLQTDQLLAAFYSACDLFICPSLQDNLPNTVIESISCGTPVLAFATGGLPDMVKANISGLCVQPTGCSSALYKGLVSLISNPSHLARLRVSSRQLSLSDYPLALQAGRYNDLYHQII